MLRLLSLEDEIKELLQENKLSMGHARALLSLPAGNERVLAARKILSEGLNVRQVESLGKEKKTQKPREKKEGVYPDVERELSQKFGTKVRIKGNRKGKIEMEFYSVSDLTRLVDLLN